MKRKKRLRKIVALLLALMLLLSSFLQLLAQEEMIEIRTYEDLLSIEKNPNGYYILQNDIDLEGKSWTPFPFSGTLNGNHHAILNLKIENIGKETYLTYDGNYKTYDTQFSGLFSHIENADIRHLSFYNVDIALTTDTPTYVGTIAGYNENSTIQDCHIEGRIELHNRSAAHGIGGICGYGNGTYTQVDANVTLIDIDEDKVYMDEQFLGGICSSGYPNIENCNIHLDAYISEHGYVHSGGLVGMYFYYPEEYDGFGYVSNNMTNGTIQFFEDNLDRRAYCSRDIGETLTYSYAIGNNTGDFTPLEIFQYEENLYPQYNEEAKIIEATCSQLGYRERYSQSGHVLKDSYKLPSHTYQDWITIKEPTYLESGIQESKCIQCGNTITQAIERIIDIKKASFPETELHIQEKESFHLPLVYEPSNAIIDEDNFSISDTNILKRNADGTFTALQSGEAIISCKDHTNQILAECKIIVEKEKDLWLLAFLASLAIFLFFILFRLLTSKRKRKISLILFFLLIPLIQPIQAIETSLPLQVYVNQYPYSHLCDANYETNQFLTPQDNILLTSTTPFSALYIEFEQIASHFTITYEDTTQTIDPTYLHEYIVLEKPTTELTIQFTSNEIVKDFYITDSSHPDPEIQIWQSIPDGEADILVFATHADDDILFLGGVLAEYGGERDLKVQVAYLCDFNLTHPIREHEKLDGLWTNGIRYYPVNGSFQDYYCLTLEEAEAFYSYEDILNFVTTQIRRYKPEIVVTQDEFGEYGHGDHQILVKAVKEAVDHSFEESFQEESAKVYGSFDVKKTYLHLYKQNQIRLDLRKPLTAFQNKTALDVMNEAFLKHVSQQGGPFYVTDDPNVVEYDAAAFGLYRSTVGLDTTNDMTENTRLSPNYIEETPISEPQEETTISEKEEEKKVEVLEPIIEEESIEEPIETPTTTYSSTTISLPPLLLTIFALTIMLYKIIHDA